MEDLKTVMPPEWLLKLLSELADLQVKRLRFVQSKMQTKEGAS